MSTIRFSQTDDQICRFTDNLPQRSAARFPPLTLIVGHQASWGLGLRADAIVPMFGTVRLVHWILSPYADVPDGIVEDCASSRLRQVFGTESAGLHFKAIGQPIDLPICRLDHRNLIFSGKLLGLRGWDIRHDRHASIIDLGSGLSDITGTELPSSVQASWIFAASSGSRRIEIEIG